MTHFPDGLEDRAARNHPPLSQRGHAKNMKRKTDGNATSRRAFLGAAVPALAFGGRTAEGRARDGAEAQAPAAPTAPAPGAIDVPALRAGQAISGLHQTDEALGKAVSLVTRYRGHLDTLRTFDVATDVEPAFLFDPRQRAKPRPTAAALPARPPAKPAARRIAPPSSRMEIAFASAARLQAWLKSRHISSEELASVCLDRLKEHQPTLSCVVTLTDRRAMTEARHADATRDARTDGPLRGIPYGAKDLFDSEGTRALWGAKPYHHRRIPAQDATAIARLKSAGACLTAKLATGELAIGDVWSGEPQFEDGRPLSNDGAGVRGLKTKNPWDPTTGASGSSAGSASAVAAGLVPFALGTETGGSIVSPASTCGVVGLRPTYGRVSRSGVMTLRWTMDKVGVLARSVEDCGLVLGAIHGPDGRDRSVTQTPFMWSPATLPSLRGRRLGIIEKELSEPETGASDQDRARFALSRAVFEQAVEFYKKAGCAIVPLKLPDFPAAALYAIHNAEGGAMFDDITRSGAVDELEGQGPSDRSSQLRASRFIPAVDYLRAQRLRTLLIGEIEDILGPVDAFLAPPSSDSVNMTNLTGHPCLVLPAGFVNSAAGLDLPQNIMLTGHLDDEATLLDLGLAFERETPWHTRRPPLYS